MMQWSTSQSLSLPRCWLRRRMNCIVAPSRPADQIHMKINMHILPDHDMCCCSGPQQPRFSHLPVSNGVPSRLSIRRIPGFCQSYTVRRDLGASTVACFDLPRSGCSLPPDGLKVELWAGRKMAATTPRRPNHLQAVGDRSAALFNSFVSLCRSYRRPKCQVATFFSDRQGWLVKRLQPKIESTTGPSEGSRAVHSPPGFPGLES